MIKFTQIIHRVLAILTTLVLVIMMVQVVAHAALRSLFNAPIYGTNEIVTFWYMPLVVLLGLYAAQLNDEQITVTILTSRLSRFASTVFKVFALVLGAAVSVGFAWFGFHEALEKMAVGATARATDIIIWPIYFLVPVAFLMLTYLLIANIITTFRMGDSVSHSVPSGNKESKESVY